MSIAIQLLLPSCSSRIYRLRSSTDYATYCDRTEVCNESLTYSLIHQAQSFPISLVVSLLLSSRLNEQVSPNNNLQQWIGILVYLEQKSVTTHEDRDFIPMDPASALGLVVTAVTLTSSCLKECRKFIGPSKHSTTDVRSISEHLWAFNGSLKNLQTHYEIYEDSQARSITLPSIKEPLSYCNEALDFIREHLESTNSLKRFITGARFDTALEKNLNCLKKSRILFHEVLQADHMYNTRIPPCK